MSEETQVGFEDYSPERKGSLFGDIAMISVALGLNFVLLSPFLMVNRTMGSSTTDTLDRNGRPLLLELRNCRVISQEPAASPVPVGSPAKPVVSD